MICISPAIVLVPLRPGAGHEQHLARVVLGLDVVRASLTVGDGSHGWQPIRCGHGVRASRSRRRPAVAARRRGPRVRRGRYLPACLDSVLGADARRPRGRGRRRRLAGRLGRDRRRVRRPRRPGRGSCTPPTAASARPATRGCGTSRATTSAFADSDDVVPPAALRRAGWRRSRQTGLRLRRPARSCAGRRDRACTSRRGCGGCTTAPLAGMTARRAPRDPRRRVRVEQALPHARSGTRAGAHVARGRPLRGPADDDPRVPRRHGSTSLPDVVYHWRIRARRHLDHPAARVDRRPARPVATKRMALAAVEEYDRRAAALGGLPSTGCWPATCTATSSRSRAAPTSGGAAARGIARHLGRPLAGAQRPAARAPADRLAGRAGPAGRRGRR